MPNSTKKKLIQFRFNEPKEIVYFENISRKRVDGNVGEKSLSSSSHSPPEKKRETKSAKLVLRFNFRPDVKKSSGERIKRTKKKSKMRF